VDALQVQISQIIIQVIFYSGIAEATALALFWKWWRSELGWSIVAMTLSLSLALLGIMLVYWFGPNGVTRSPVVQWFTLVMLAAVPVITWWRVWVIYKAQRRGARHY
jgi:ABC-type molybdate transport system permease subunit